MLFSKKELSIKIRNLNIIIICTSN